MCTYGRIWSQRLSAWFDSATVVKVPIWVTPCTVLERGTNFAEPTHYPPAVGVWPRREGQLRRPHADRAAWLALAGAVHNRRSLVALDNLVDFIVTCVTHPQPANQTFLVSDGHDLSTTELVRGLARAAGVPARLLPVPVWALRAGATLLGKSDAVQRLCGNLLMDISKARSLLGWVPPVSVNEGFRRAVAGMQKP